MRWPIATYLLACSGAASSCGADAQPIAAPAPAAESAPLPAPSSTATPWSIVATPCVLHAGSAKGHVDSDGHTSGSCTLGAECRPHPGNAASGDGFVDLTCENASCTCAWSSATDKRGLHASFVAETICVDVDVAKRIFMGHCMKGLRLYVDGAH